MQMLQVIGLINVIALMLTILDPELVMLLSAGCPVIWQSKLQGEIVLSSTEAEYISISTSLRECILLTNLLQEFQKHGTAWA